jgi:hypothetical protein
MKKTSEASGLQREKLLGSLFENYQGLAFAVRLWDGWRWQYPSRGTPACTIVLNSPIALRSLVIRPSEVTLGEAFLNKDIDVEGDLFSVFALRPLGCERHRSQSVSTEHRTRSTPSLNLARIDLQTGPLSIDDFRPLGSLTALRNGLWPLSYRRARIIIIEIQCRPKRCKTIHDH